MKLPKNFVLRVKNQLRGEILVKATLAESGELTVVVASQVTHPPAGSLPIRMGETEEILKGGE